MGYVVGEDISIKLIYFFLSCVGIGLPRTKNERRLMNLQLVVFYNMSVIGLTAAGTDIYYSFKQGSIVEVAFGLFLLLMAILTSAKLIIVTIQRNHYENILRITREKLWTNCFTEYGETVLKKCQYQARLFFLVYIVIGHVTDVAFIGEAIVLNMQSNLTDPNNRHLPVRIWLDVPVYETPYYEFFFALGAFGIYIVTILYFAFDYYLVLVNIFVVGHFEILKRRLEECYKSKKALPTPMNWYDNEQFYGNELITMDIIRREFKDCVEQHQFLIWLIGEMECLYNVMNLLQVLIFSFIICIVGYQLQLPGTTVGYTKMGIFMIGCVIQLFTFTLSCHNVMIASVEIADGTYNSKWYYENRSEFGRSLTRDFVMVIMKTRNPCFVTGAGFFPITLNTLKSILTTAFSYLTLIRQSMNEENSVD